MEKARKRLEGRRGGKEWELYNKTLKRKGAAFTYVVLT